MQNLQQRKTNASDPIEEEASVARKINSDYQEKYGFSDKIKNDTDFGKGLSEDIVRKISAIKNEPRWMLDLRLKAYKHFQDRVMPEWGADLKDINFDDIHYFVRATDKRGRDWNEVPSEIKNTFERLGIPQAERKFLAGVASQYESEVVYQQLKEEWAKEGVVFFDTDTGLKEHPELFKKYFAKIIPYTDNKFAALNTAVWSGGSFIYVPKGVKVKTPLQAYFRINAKNMGQFERTLIIVDEGAEVSYIEGCFKAGTSILTKLGEKSIEDIKVGDMVLTHKRRYQKVTKLIPRIHKGDVYKIKYYGDTSAELNITGEHPLYLVKRKRHRDRNTEYKPEWVDAKYAKKKDYLAIPIKPKYHLLSEPELTIKMGRNHLPTIFKFPLEKDFFRLIGYYLAEGYCSNEHYLTISFNVNEKEYIEDVTRILEKYTKKKVILNKIHQNGQTVVLSSTLFARSFNTVFGHNAYSKKIPSWLYNDNAELVQEVIKGMWRGDGSFDEKRQLFRYNSINRDLAVFFKDCLLGLGIIASVNLQKRKSPRKNIYAVVISRPDNKKFGRIVGILCKNGRKTGSPLTLKDDFLFAPIKSIEKKSEKTQVYNFAVEKDESYVAEGVVVHNCTAPTYTTDSLHSAVVEIYVERGARCRYTTIQNWSSNVYNLVTKRASAKANAVMEWVDCNLGSKVTMKYPSVYLLEPGAHGEVLSIALANKDQHQDAGAKMFHIAPKTSSLIMSKSICLNGGRTSYRGMVKIPKGSRQSKSNVICDALILDSDSRTDTYPVNLIDEQEVTLGHEASVSKVNQEQLFYLMSHGLSEEQASAMIVAGFIEPIMKELPMEYAMELNALIQMTMEGSVG